MRAVARTLRRVLVTSLISASLLSLLPAPQAEAVCGGGSPGEPCYCPSEITVAGKQISTGISC